MVARRVRVVSKPLLRLPVAVLGCGLRGRLEPRAVAGRRRSGIRLLVRDRGGQRDAHRQSRHALPDFAEVRHRQDATWLDLQHVVVDQTYADPDFSLYRGSASFRTASTTVTVGRQRIAGARRGSGAQRTCSIRSTHSEVEGDVRQGVDAVQVEWAPPDCGWRAAAVYAPQGRWERSTAAFRVGRTVAGWDITAFGGRFRQDWVGGADAAGQWGGAGVRAEMTYTRRGEDLPPERQCAPIHRRRRLRVVPALRRRRVLLQPGPAAVRLDRRVRC